MFGKSSHLELIAVVLFLRGHKKPQQPKSMGIRMWPWRASGNDGASRELNETSMELHVSCAVHWNETAHLRPHNGHDVSAARHEPAAQVLQHVMLRAKLSYFLFITYRFPSSANIPCFLIFGLLERDLATEKIARCTAAGLIYGHVRLGWLILRHWVVPLLPSTRSEEAIFPHPADHALPKLFCERGSLL